MNALAKDKETSKMDPCKEKENEKGKSTPKKNVKTSGSEASKDTEGNEARKLLLQLEKMERFKF